MTDVSNNQRVLNALRDARTKIEKLEQARSEPIAVIGMAGRFPGAEDLNAFWDLLVAGSTGMRMLSGAELAQAGVPESLSSQPDYVPAWASFDQPTAFDAGLFGYSPKDARVLDPQHRVFLECAWHALEDAGYDGARYNQDIGVFAGAALNSHLINLHNHPTLRHDTDQVQAVVSNLLGLMPTRVSYHLNLTGPSCGVQTGCSTSLVAIHQACNSLHNDECQMALAGAVTLSETQAQGYLYQPEGIASPDGKTRSFDAQGQGTMFGNGVGIVVLKRLSNAIADGDRIIALIKGSAVNNDGADKVGLLAPSVNGQARVIRAALQKAGVEPDSISLIEAHGTATSLGDPVEFAALNKVFGDHSAQPCELGSVKSNVGHLDAAAGMAGLVKTLLALQHKTIPASLHFETPNPSMDFSRSRLQVTQVNTSWQTPDPSTPLRAGVSSFGMGGTNAHVVVEQAPSEAVAQSSQLPPRRWQLLPLSAQHPVALETLKERLQEHLRNSQQTRLDAAAFTLQVGRRQLAERMAFVAESVAGSVSQLLPVAKPSLASTGECKLVFVFPGQGSQRVHLAQDLYQNEPLFKQHLDECAQLLGQQPNPLDLLELLYPAQVDSQTRKQLRRTQVAQPLLFAVEYALARLLQHWGIEPDLMVGHSVGEYVAACLAGVFSLSDALSLVSRRAELMQQCPSGSMLAIGMGEADLMAWLQQPGRPTGWDLAAVNSTQQTVLSGPTPVIENLLAQLEEAGVPARLLQTSHGFHSRSMDAALEPFAAACDQVQFKPALIPIYSAMDGSLLRAPDSHYWVHQLRQPVRFDQAIEACIGSASQQPLVLLEVGPETLAPLLKTANTNTPYGVFSCLSAAKKLSQTSDEQQLTSALGFIWQAGITLDWDAYQQGRPQQRTALPLYPFQRQDFAVPSNQGTQSTQLATNQLASGHSYQLHWEVAAPFVAAAVNSSDRNLVLLMQDDTSSEDLALWSQLGSVEVLTADTLTGLQGASYDHWVVVASSPRVQTDTPQQGLTERLTHRLLQLMTLVQNLAEHSDSALPISMQLVTSGAYGLTRAESVDPAQAGLNGFWQVINQELPGITSRQLDLEAGITLAQQWGEASQTLHQLHTESLSAFHSLQLVRNGIQWQRAYRGLPSAQLAQDQSPLVVGGNYLIVGDLAQGMGMVIAQGLHRQLGAHLIFCTQTALPQRTEWESWLATHGPRHPVSVMIRSLQGLLQEGLSYEWLQVDNLAFQDWSNLLQQQPIAGIFTVDTMGDNNAIEMVAAGAEDIESIVGQRLELLSALQQACESSSQPPPFVAVQSSLSTLVGGYGFSIYAALNAAVNSLVAQCQQHSRHTRWLAINWDAMATDIMAIPADGDIQTGSKLVDDALSVEQSWQALKTVLSHPGANQAAVTVNELGARIQSAFAIGGDSSADVQRAKEGGRPDLATPYVAPRTDTEQLVTQAMGELLGIHRVGVNDDFFDLGGHSLLAIQAVTRLRKEFNVELPMRALLFEARTPAGIAAVIEASSPKQPTLAVDDEDLESLLDEIENLSPDEAAEQLT